MPWLIGYPREKIKWYPTIDKNKCIKCGMCMNCGKNVYDWDKAGPTVASPFNCVVGCSTCANLCEGDAITFPDIKNVKKIYKDEKIWLKVKKQLKEEGKLETEE